MKKEELYQLIDKYLDGRTSPEEEKLLHGYLASYQTSLEWDEHKMGLKHELEQKMLNRLMESMRDVKQERKNAHFSFKWKKLAAAAVVVMAVSTALYFAIAGRLDGDHAGQMAIKFKNDIAPGAGKAILTLADGSEVLLDDKLNGLVAEQGSTAIRKSASGELIYQSAGKPANETAMNRISTSAGGKYQVRLPDDTKVWLNAASSLRFPVAFTGKQRVVELVGEAYFEVAKLSKKGSKIPFVVKAGNTEVTVLGTHFNISAYSGDPEEKTTLLEGSVRIGDKILKPGQQARMTSSKDLTITSNVNIESVMAWKSDVFMFDSTPLETVMQQIGRWYDAEIVYEGPRPNVSFNGIIPRGTYASRVLEVLESAGGVKFNINGNKIVVKRNKN